MIYELRGGVRGTSKCEVRHVIITHIHANKYRGHHGKVSVCVCACVSVCGGQLSTLLA